MVLDGLDRALHLRRDLLVGLAGSEKHEHSNFGLRQRDGRGVASVGHLAQALEQLAHHLLRYHHAVIGEGFESVDKLDCGQHLREVAVCAGLNRLHHVRLVLVGGQYQHIRTRALLADQPRRGDAVEVRELDVHQDHVGLELARQADGFPSVGGFTDDLDDLLVLKKIFDAFTEKRLVVGDQHLHSFFRDNLRSHFDPPRIFASLAENYERFSQKVKPKSLRPRRPAR